MLAIGVGVAGATPLWAVHVSMLNSLLGSFVGIVVGSFADPGRSASAVKSWRLYNTALSYFDTSLKLFEGMFPARRLLITCVRTTVNGIVTPLRRGADATLQEKRGSSAAALARQQGHTATVDWWSPADDVAETSYLVQFWDAKYESTLNNYSKSQTTQIFHIN